jgi:hypothetical protein
VGEPSAMSWTIEGNTFTVAVCTTMERYEIARRTLRKCILIAQIDGFVWLEVRKNWESKRKVGVVVALLLQRQ